MMLLISWMMSSIPAMILENQSQPSSKVVFIRVPTAVRIFLLHVLQWPFDMLQRRMLQYTCSFRIPPEQKNQQGWIHQVLLDYLKWDQVQCSLIQSEMLIYPLFQKIQDHCWVIVAEGKNLMRKLERDQMQMTPRNWRTFKSVPSELFIAKLCVVISAPLTVNDRAVTNCAALLSWCNL